MNKKIYQKNPGRDDDWVVEGGLDEADLQALAKNGKIRGLEFYSVLDWPERPFRRLTSLRQLKHFRFHACVLSPHDVADLASNSKLESLWFENCPVGDEGLEHLAGHPKLARIVLDHARITDAALEHLAAIPRLEWLGLDATAVTDHGIAQLAKSDKLKHLALRDTAVTDQGLLPLAVLTKLNLTVDNVRGSRVTQAGLDALFAAQKTARATGKGSQKSATAAPPALDPTEINVATANLYAFFKAVHDWQIECESSYNAAKQQSSIDVEDCDAWENCREECRRIFECYCTPKRRAFGRPEHFSISNAPDYMADPAQEPISAIDAQATRRIVIETRQEFGVRYRCQYVLLKQGDRWLIDNKKIWRAAWEPTLL